MSPSELVTPAEYLDSIDLPKLAHVDSISLRSNDWFVVCGGFEERACSALQMAIASSNEGFNVLLIEYAPVIDENRAEEIRQICKRSKIMLRSITYLRHSPEGLGDEIIRAMDDTSGRLFIDISAMSRLLIVQMLVAIGCRPQSFENCTIVYSEANYYSPNEKEAQSRRAELESDPTMCAFFLSSGVFDITVVPELSSCAMTGPQSRLVAFPSLDAHHLISLRTELQPSRLTIIEGVPPRPESRWRQKLIADVNCLHQMPDAERFEASTLDYVETLKALSTTYREHAVYERIIVAPTGSKMQALAVGVFRAFVHDAQIVFPTASRFESPKDYTQGFRQIYLLDLSRFASSFTGCATPE